MILSFLNDLVALFIVIILCNPLWCYPLWRNVWQRVQIKYCFLIRKFRRLFSIYCWFFLS